jgi:hypothetical protein
MYVACNFSNISRVVLYICTTTSDIGSTEKRSPSPDIYEINDWCLACRTSEGVDTQCIRDAQAESQLFGWGQEGLAKRAYWWKPVRSPPSHTDLPTMISSLPKAACTVVHPHGRDCKPSPAAGTRYNLLQATDRQRPSKNPFGKS